MNPLAFVLFGVGVEFGVFGDFSRVDSSTIFIAVSHFGDFIIGYSEAVFEDAFYVFGLSSMVAVFHMPFVEVFFVFLDDKFEGVTRPGVTMISSEFNMVIIVEVVAAIFEGKL